MSAETTFPVSKLQPPPAELTRQSLVLNNRSIGWISDHIAGIVEGKTPKWWWPAFIVSFLGMSMMFGLITYLISTGVGVWATMRRPKNSVPTVRPT